MVKRQVMAVQLPSPSQVSFCAEGKMKNQIVTAYKNQIVVAFIVGGGVIIATAIFIFALMRIVCVEGIAKYRPLIRPVSEKLNAFRQTDHAA
jgi:hypothetical protein